MTASLTSALPYTLEFEHRSEYLYAKVTGKEDSYAISHDYWVKVSEERKKRHYKKILVDENLEQQVSFMDAYELAGMLIEDGFAGVVIAFVDRQMDHLDYNQFAETVAVNRGIKCKAFVDFDEAEKWLLSA